MRRRRARGHQSPVSEVVNVSLGEGEGGKKEVRRSLSK